VMTLITLKLKHDKRSVMLIKKSTIELYAEMP